MTALSVQPTFPIFTDIDGQPLEAGYIFIGVANLAPIGNPISVFWDAALTLPAAQPIRTIGGYPVNAGTPARLYVNSDYSIQVQNRNGSVVYSAPAATERYGNIISSADISFIQAGSGAVTRTAQAKMRETVSVKDFGAVGDGVADDTAAIQAAVTYAKTLTSPKLVINNGTYLTSSTLTFDLPNYSTIEFIGEIVTATGLPAVRIGSSSANIFGLEVFGLKVRRLSNDTSGGSTGVQLRNLAWSYVDVRKCIGFQDGVFCYGDQPNGGFSYNEVHLGFVHDNKRNLYLLGAGSGYCNENNFYGGSFNHSTTYPAVSTTNLEIAHFPANALNNNRFYGPSFEDNSALATAAIINGTSNVIFWPRMENPGNQPNYQIQFTANSLECRLIGASFTFVESNISDLGSGNIYETRNGLSLQYQTPAASNRAVLKLKSTTSSSARALQVLDAGGVERSFIQGDGTFRSRVVDQMDSGGVRTTSLANGTLLVSAGSYSGTAGFATFGFGNQLTVGAAGGAAALPATPNGYLVFYLGTTKFVIPYYNA